MFVRTALMPPDDSTAYDIHLERSLHDLDNLRDDLSYDIAIIYNNRDIPDVGEDLKKIHPRKIKIDLENNGYSVWVSASWCCIMVCVCACLCVCLFVCVFVCVCVLEGEEGWERVREKQWVHIKW